MSSPRVKQLLEANTKFAETWSAPPTMEQMRAGVSEGVLVLTCMDPRVVPEQFLGPMPRVAVFRNAGGHASPDVVRTINVFQTLFKNGEIKTVMVVHHTDCGMTHLTNEEIIEEGRKRGVDTSAIDFGCFTEEQLKQSVLDDVQILKNDNRVKGVDIRGFILDTNSGLLEEVW